MRYAVTIFMCMNNGRLHQNTIQELENRRRCYREHIRGGRRGRMPNFQYPPDLATNVPAFPTWLHGYVRNALETSAEIDEDLVMIANPPSRLALHFPHMWAYGNHFRTDNEQHCRRHSTYDSAIATLFTEPVRAGGVDSGVVEVTLQYVGILKEILMVTFGTLKVTLMRASWINMDNGNGAPSTVRDECGFFLVQHERRLPALEAPYVFPSQVSQVSIVLKLVCLCVPGSACHVGAPHVMAYMFNFYADQQVHRHESCSKDTDNISRTCVVCAGILHT